RQQSRRVAAHTVEHCLTQGHLPCVTHEQGDAHDHARRQSNLDEDGQLTAVQGQGKSQGPDHQDRQEQPSRPGTSWGWHSDLLLGAVDDSSGRGTHTVTSWCSVGRRAACQTITTSITMSATTV